MADHPYRPHDQQEQQNKGSVLPEVGALAALGIGLAIPRSRAAIRDTAQDAIRVAQSAGAHTASYLARDNGIGGAAKSVMGYVKAFDSALDQRSPIAHALNPKRFQDRFDNSLKRQADDLAKQAEGKLKNIPTDMEVRYAQFIPDKRRQNKQYRQAVASELRMGQLKKRLPEHFETGLEGILNQQRSDFFTDPNKGRIENLLDRYSRANKEKNNNNFVIDIDPNDNEAKSKFIDSMFKTLQDYKDTKKIDRKILNSGGEIDGVKIQGAKNVSKKADEEFLQSNLKKDDFFSKLMSSITGQRQAQFKDYLDHDGDKFVAKMFDNASQVAFRKDGEEGFLRAGQKMAAMANKDTRFLDAIVDPHIMIDESGRFYDYRGVYKAIGAGLDSFERNVQVPFLRFNPLNLLHYSTIKDVKSAPQNYLLRKGTIVPGLGARVETTAHPKAHNQDAAVGVLAKDYIYNNGVISNLVSGDVVAENVYLASARYGPPARMMASLGNLHKVDYAEKNWFQSLFDVGQQETDTLFGRMASTFTKVDDPDWARNRYRKLFTENPSTEAGMREVESSYKDLYAEIHSRSKPLSDDMSQYLNQFAKQAYGDDLVDLTKLTTTEEVMGTLGRMVNALGEKNHRIVDNSLGEVMGKMWRDYHEDPQDFLKDKRIVSDHAPYMMGPLQAVDAHEVTEVAKIDDVRRLIHQHVIDQVDQRGPKQIGSLVREGIESGKLDKKAMSEVQDLSVLNRMQDYWKEVYLDGPDAKTNALFDFHYEVNRNGANNPFNLNLNAVVKRQTPLWAMGPGDKPPQYFGFTGYTVMNKARGYKWMMQDMNQKIEQGVDPIKAMFGSAGKVLGQPFAGRHNLEDFTTASAMFYYAAERLDNTMAKVGLGLSQKNRASMQGIFAQQLGRRIALPYMAVQQAMWLDDQTGDFFSDKAAETYANMTMDVGWFKEVTGLNSIGKEAEDMMPGLDQLWRTPIGGALKYGTFGFLGDTRSDEELEHYYEHGEEAVRKGRWWGVGSTTPWQGGKIDRYIPNWYRRAKSDYKYTDTMYGSEDEYWANHWMPTLNNPLAPLRHFITDPGHYEDKHREDRPYPISGGIQELGMIPVIGPLVNRTVGGILNPFVEHKDLKKAHREYITEVNQYVESQYQSSLGGGQLQFMPAGGYQMMSEQTAFGGGFGEGFSALMMPTSSGSGGTGIGGNYSRAQLSALNTSIAGGGSGGAMMLPSRPVNTLESLRDTDTISDLMDIASPHSNGNVGQDLWYNTTELLGIYGFSANWLSGIDTNVRERALDRSSRMMSYSRAYWDMEMGGFDGPFAGEFSEIFRRYVARDPRKEYYNPLKNTMPDWMPGVNYFIDFKHGDPYTKVPKGEMRLPGASYEALNKLHPDSFGEYGAFDRFKILADVAPYSDEYKYWRKTVSAMKQEGMLTEEMDAQFTEVKDQVASKKKKYNFYPNKFRNAEVKRETVTVTQMIDPTTFLTAEHPDNPIRLAGVDIKADGVEAQEWLSQYVYKGAKIDIDVDADPLFRVRDDTMNTIRAVVYSNGDDGMPWYMSTKGQSVNAMLSRKKFQDKDSVTVKPENSAIGTVAMYDSAEITVGSMMEWAAHDLIPNIPIVGVIADKFMPVRSPLEMYKRNEVYGKAWRPWTDPWGGWIQPMLETMASKNPVVAAAQGYGIGWMFGKAGAGRYYGKWGGAAIAGTLASIRTIDEFIGMRGPDGDTYASIPARRKREREINQYFDVLKYMKYKGLYEKASREAIRYEGIDIDKMLNENDERGENNKKLRRYLETSKKWLSISKNSGYIDEDGIKEQYDKAQGKLKMIDADRPTQNIGPKTMQALQYKAQYESTLYGADPNGDMTKIFRALPSKDREFFTEFMTASPKERDEILRLVPEDQRRFYQAKWGMEVDDKPKLSAFFKDKFLPDKNWEGWDPNVDLEDVKLKVVRNEGLEMSDFGMWRDDMEKSERSGVERINPFKPSMMIDPSRLEEILRGAGLTDVSVNMTTSPARGESRINIGLDYIKDRMNEVKGELGSTIGSLLT